MKKLSRTKIVKKLDAVFSEYIRLRDSNSRGIVECPLCGKRIYWKQAQNMHFISRGVIKYRYSEKNCHAGCMRCNVILHGNYIEYTRFMQRKYGFEFVESIVRDKAAYKIPTPELLTMIYKYEFKRDNLLKLKNLGN